MSDLPEPQVEIAVPDAVKLGSYANFLVVTHTAHEFTLDFCQVLPGGDPALMQAEVVNRVKIAPTLAGKVIRALNENMTMYEDKFGLVPDVG